MKNKCLIINKTKIYQFNVKKDTERWVSIFNFKDPYNQLQKQSVARIMDKVIENRIKT